MFVHAMHDDFVPRVRIQTMTLRAVAAVIGGIVLWPALFLAVGIGFGLAWPAYRVAARLFLDSQNFSLFTIGMMLTNFVAFAVAGLATGSLVAWIGRSRTAALVLGLLCLGYGLVDHYYLLWDILPTWYNLVVPWIMAGSIVMGSRFMAVRRFADVEPVRKQADAGL
jgi:hypothetical protein